ncbi:bifunctional glycosyltransferase family 2 protein/CDP-glycerol:glycerophosphate glycerophosphotransferase [Eggerthia catenaformis]|uniref:bifunctional glycosyltransferase family 2 protein/CDP-glycerol:glycerophosphate glycerophosphotransferase n=1 Tax=Eggerthia catenaformis TaxID=31973 RepID=UPI00047D438D|nr:bifunctional glycosyltransferase family 2 protein/CDP-glycerol:glycerophosphate glycerophosphotransferase [Eggerthia catenaformis]
MKISVIIPFDCYENYLKDCLDSLENQTFKDFEALLIANADTYLDQSMLDGYTLNLRVIPADASSSTAVKRNIGLNNATGEYVYFLDADDYIAPDALERLAAVSYDVELISGIRKHTWFKKDVFEAMGNQKNDELDLKDKDHDQLELVYDKMYNENNKDEEKTDVLVQSRNTLNDISVLNILIKKSLIDKIDLRFNEEFEYYSDVPFVISLVKEAKSFVLAEKAIYVKRKHNDPINTPALSQVKDPAKRFDEFIQAYLYGASIVSSDSYERLSLDEKLLFFYEDTFAKKIHRSEDDDWRNERFKTMGSVLKLVHPDVVKASRYRKKLTAAAIEGDLKGAEKIIKRKLAFDKAKKIFQNKNEWNKYLYQHNYKNKPVDSRIIVFESFRGASYSDTPKYIYEYLAKNYPGEYKFVWVLNDKSYTLPYEGQIVKRFSRKYAYYMGIAKYFVFNTRQPLWFRKREEQIFLETWHGTPLKRLAFDQEEVTAASPSYKTQFYRQKQEWDFLIAANKFSSDVFRSCFMYDGPMLETGYPRNDLLKDPDRDEIMIELKKKCGIPLSKRTILYAPTWRDDEYYGNGSYKFQIKLNLEMMKKELGDEYVVILRTHYYIADNIDLTGLEDFAYNLSKYDDVTEIYLMSDILITDYSSVFFDYAGLRRPMLFFTYDLDKYRDILRGFYIDMEKELPGPLVYTTEEVINRIKSIDEMNKEYASRYDAFYERFCCWEDGHATKRVVDAVFFGDKEYINCVENDEEKTA